MSFAGRPQRDRAPDTLAAGTPPELRDDLVALLGADRVLTRPIDLVRFATDASPYRLFPKVVVIARNVDDVRKVLEYARQRHESVTFRAAGTSLSGPGAGRWHSGRRQAALGRRQQSKQGGDACARAPARSCRAPTSRCFGHGYRLGPDPASASAARSAASWPTTPVACAAARRRTHTRRCRHSRSCCPSGTLHR